MVNERLIYIAAGTKSVTNQVFALIRPGAGNASATGLSGQQRHSHRPVNNSWATGRMLDLIFEAAHKTSVESIEAGSQE